MLVQPSFPRAPRLTRGYQSGQVDAFFTRVLGARVTAGQVRTVGFDLVYGGYAVEVVDEALDRLEDDLAQAEREQLRSQLGERGFVAKLTGQAQMLRGRLAREHGDRFARAAGWSSGYDMGDVDDLCDQIADYFDGEQSLSVAELRAAVFRTRRGARAYSEPAVDNFLDRVVAVISSVG